MPRAVIAVIVHPLVDVDSLSSDQVRDIFAGEIDFHRDLLRGDRFSVVYEQHYLGGREVHAGRVTYVPDGVDEWIRVGESASESHVERS